MTEESYKIEKVKIEKVKKEKYCSCAHKMTPSREI